MCFKEAQDLLNMDLGSQLCRPAGQAMPNERVLSDVLVTDGCPHTDAL